MSETRDAERPFDGQAEGVGVVLHEERLRAGVERVETGRVQVRKRVVTEEVTVTVPVRREVVDLVRVYEDGSEEALDLPPSYWEPRFEQADAVQAPASTDDGGVFDVERANREQRPGAEGEYDIVLHEERPVVSTATYAVEVLRLGVTREREVVPVTGEVRREVVDVDGVQVDVATGEARI